MIPAIGAVPLRLVVTGPIGRVPHALEQSGLTPHEGLTKQFGLPQVHRLLDAACFGSLARAD
jgi:hypothetical protein